MFFYFAIFLTIEVPIASRFFFFFHRVYFSITLSVVDKIRGCKMFSNILENNNVGLTAVSPPKLPVRQSLYRAQSQKEMLLEGRPSMLHYNMETSELLL